MKAIGIDIGTTSVCGVVIDTESGKVIRSCTEESSAWLCGAADYEKIQSAEKIISKAFEILDGFIDGDIAAIGVTGQMHGIVYVDADGKAVSPLYTWQDGRGNLPFGDTTYANRLGSFSGYGNVTDFYNRENGIRPRTAVTYCTIHDYFVMRLCGLKNPLIHSTDAASFGLYDIKENRFDYDVGATVVSGYKIAGEYKNIPVSVAIGDNQASVFSTLADTENVLINVGTGSQVSVISDEPIECENIETRPYFEDKYLVVGSALCGGRAYSILKNFYAEILGYIKEMGSDEVYSIMDEMLKRNEIAGLFVDTRFCGTRNDPEKTGSIIGMTPENFNPSALTWGVLEGMADELFSMYKNMGRACRGLVASGNGIRKNASALKVFERKFGAKIMIPTHLEEASFGAALFALISCGAFKNAREAQKLIKYE